MNGSVMPVIGTRLATTAMFTQAWKTSHVVMPAARRAPVASRARTEPGDREERDEVSDRHAQHGAEQRKTRIGIAQRRRRERPEGDARLGHELTLEPATTTDEQEPYVRIVLA